MLLRYHRVVRSLYAIGGNEDAARAAGIRVERVTIGVYVVASAMAAFAGLCVTAQLGAVASSQGDGSAPSGKSPTKPSAQARRSAASVGSTGSRW